MAESHHALSKLLHETPLWPWRPARLGGAVAGPVVDAALASPAEADLCRLAASISTEQEALAANAEAARVRIAGLIAAAAPDSGEASALAALSAQIDAVQALKQTILETEAVAVDAALEALQTELSSAREASAGTSAAALDSLPRVQTLFQRLRSLPCAPLEPSIVRVVDVVPEEHTTHGCRLFAPRGPKATDVHLLTSIPQRLRPGDPLRLSCVLSEEYEPTSVTAEEQSVLAGMLSTHLSLEVEVSRVAGDITDSAPLPRDDGSRADSAAALPPISILPSLGVRASGPVSVAGRVPQPSSRCPAPGPAARVRTTATPPPLHPSAKCPPMSVASSSAARASAPSRAVVGVSAIGRRTAATRPPLLPASAARRPADAGASQVASASPAAASPLRVSPRTVLPLPESGNPLAVPDAVSFATSGSPRATVALLTLAVQCIPARGVECSGAPSSADVRRFDLVSTLPIPLDIGDSLHVLSIRVHGTAMSTAALPSTVIVSASVGLSSPQYIEFTVKHEYDDAIIPCVADAGSVLFAPPLDAPSVTLRTADRQRGLCTVCACDGTRVSDIAWHALGLEDAPSSCAFVTAYDDTSSTLFAVDGGRIAVDGARMAGTRVLAIDPATPCLKWATIAGRLSGCQGLAVCQLKGLLLATSHDDSKLQLYRLRDGFRVTLRDDPPSFRHPAAVVWDARSRRIVIAHSGLAAGHAVTSLRWQATSYLRSSVASLVVDAEVTEWPDDAAIPPALWGGRQRFVMGLAVLPSPGGASHLVVGRGNMLWVHSLPGLARVASHALPEAEVVVGLAGDPSGAALIVVVRSDLPPPDVRDLTGPEQAAARLYSAERRALRVLSWPLPCTSVIKSATDEGRPRGPGAVAEPAAGAAGW